MSNPSEKEQFAATMPKAWKCQKCNGMEFSTSPTSKCVGICKCGLPIWR